ncbi:MAG: DUF4349 domain-containing protein [Planctomycetes bacterium]|nr:DUF4349 domain-containing protein [Planctomycetota bacterium]
MRCLPLCLIAILILGPGCGGRQDPAGDRVLRTLASKATDEESPVHTYHNAQKVAGREGAGEKSDEQSRKIKYTAEIGLITEDFTKTQKGVEHLVKEHQGYIASAEISGTASTGHRGSWRVRIPVKEFDAFRTDVLQLGEVVKDRSDSEDVTEEYYDLEGQIKNRQAELEGLRKLMETAADFLQRAADKDKIEYFMSVRRDVSRVQDELQRIQGRLKLLTNLTDLTTVSVNVQEKQRYLKEKGPEVAEAPTFGMRVGKTFEDSLGALKNAGAGLAIFFVALAPWLPVILVVGVPLWIVIRRHTRSPEALTPQAVVAAPITTERSRGEAGK